MFYLLTLTSTQTPLVFVLMINNTQPTQASNALLFYRLLPLLPFTSTGPLSVNSSSFAVKRLSLSKSIVSRTARSLS